MDINFAEIMELIVAYKEAEKNDDLETMVHISNVLPDWVEV